MPHHAAQQAVLLCSMLAVALDGWRSRGAGAEEAITLTRGLTAAVCGPTGVAAEAQGFRAAIAGLEAAAADARDAATRVSDHTAFLKSPCPITPPPPAQAGA